MTIALQQNKNKDTIFLMSLSYSQSYQSKLTSHPIDGAGSINDHIVTENPSFTIKGVISDVDFNASRPVNEGYSILNSNPVPDKVRVLKVEDTLLEVVTSSLLPIGRSVSPDVELSDRDQKSQLAAKLFLIDIRDKREPVSLIEFNAGIQSNEPIKNLVITSLQFSEDTNSDDALNVDITLQQATFAKLETVKITKNLAGFIKNRAASEVYKGPLSSPEKTTTLLQDVTSSLGTSLMDLVDSFKNSDGQSLPKAIKVLKDAGVFPK